MEKTIRVLVANRPRLMRELVLTTFADQPDIEIVGEVTHDSEIPASIEQTKPDFLVITLDGAGGGLRLWNGSRLPGTKRPQTCWRRLHRITFEAGTLALWGSGAIGPTGRPGTSL
jgi:DNA-binding NarL/FixJ family response regulator